MMKISFADLGLLRMSQVRRSLQKALNIHWSTLVREYGPLMNISTGVYCCQGTIPYNNLFRDGGVGRDFIRSYGRGNFVSCGNC